MSRGLGDVYKRQDVGCGFGRNAVALALRGYDVICVDSDLGWLRSLAALAPEYFQKHALGSSDIGRLYPICADAAAWPFAPKSMSAIIAVHFVRLELIDEFHRSLQAGGHFYFETFGGHGLNYISLPRSGQLRDVLSDKFVLQFYRERRVGPAGCDAVTVKLLAQKI